MFPFILPLLLLPEVLAEKAHFSIYNGYHMSINLSNIIILDNLVDNSVKCSKNGSECIFQCTAFNLSSFEGSSVSLIAEAKKFPSKVLYCMKPYGSCTLYKCTSEHILPLIQALNTGSSHEKEMMELFAIWDMCKQLFRNNNEMKKAFVVVERRIIHNIMASSQLHTQGSVEYDLKSLRLKVVNVTDADLNSAATWIRMELPQLGPLEDSSMPEIWLPVDALHTIPPEKRILGLVSYMQHPHLQFEQENFASMSVRIELVGNQSLRNLTTPVKMIFGVETQTDMDSAELQCRYFHEHGEYFRWKTDGCETQNIRQTSITCKCNHTTAFAVLLIRTNQIDEVQWEILSYISLIGCGLSAFFTALSLLMYVFSQKHRLDYSISIHLSLSGALFLLNSTFLLTEWGATLKLDWVCVFIAAFMHYSLLCCFTWMAIEALHLYLLLIKVYNIHYKHYLLKLSLVGWGIPSVIVAVSVSVKDVKQFYGVTHLGMADTNQTSSFCWITDDTFFYSLNVVYFTLVFIFNSGILMAVAASICKMQQALRGGAKPCAGADGNPRLSTSCRSGLTVLGLTCLMGTTWGLAFLGSGYVNYPILYLFCILNSTQGFFIFLWICQSAKKQRQRDMEDKITSAPKTSGVRFD